MDTELTIRPHDGIGPVKLGMNREEVLRVLEAVPGAMSGHSSHGPTDYFFSSALQVEFSADGRVQFIGASFYPGCGCRFTLFGRDPWTMPAEELFRFLADHDGGRHTFNPQEYLFPNILVTLWEAAPDYNPLQGMPFPVFGQVGIVNSVYLEAIKTITK